jgi:hypothetical protein
MTVLLSKNKIARSTDNNYAQRLGVAIQVAPIVKPTQFPSHILDLQKVLARVCPAIPTTAATMALKLFRRKSKAPKEEVKAAAKAVLPMVEVRRKRIPQGGPWECGASVVVQFAYTFKTAFRTTGQASG